MKTSSRKSKRTAKIGTSVDTNGRGSDGPKRKSRKGKRGEQQRYKDMVQVKTNEQDDEPIMEMSEEYSERSTNIGD